MTKKEGFDESETNRELQRGSLVALGKRVGEVEAAAARAEEKAARAQESANRAQADADEARAIAEQARRSSELVEKRLRELAAELQEEKTP